MPFAGVGIERTCWPHGFAQGGHADSRAGLISFGARNVQSLANQNITG